MKKISAGLIPFRRKESSIEFLLAHPGGPFYKNKDNGFWSIVKGEADENEDLLETAKREFFEETGTIPIAPFVSLGYIIQKSGKTVHAWAFEMDIDLSQGFICNTVEIPWPPKSGKTIVIQEIDKLEYFSLEEALAKVNQAQCELLLRLVKIL